MYELFTAVQDVPRAQDDKTYWKKRTEMFSSSDLLTCDRLRFLVVQILFTRNWFPFPQQMLLFMAGALWDFWPAARAAFSLLSFARFFQLTQVAKAMLSPGSTLHVCTSFLPWVPQVLRLEKSKVSSHTPAAGTFMSCPQHRLLPKKVYVL